ncbi:hypothetical protein IJJ12_00435, partial [bacterium]|nr:hypothetical protein [bacterium]
MAPEKRPAAIAVTAQKWCIATVTALNRLVLFAAAVVMYPRAIKQVEPRFLSRLPKTLCKHTTTTINLTSHRLTKTRTATPAA